MASQKGPRPTASRNGRSEDQWDAPGNKTRSLTGESLRPDRAVVPLKPEDRRAAIGLFRDDILRTQELIGRDLAAWLRA